MIYDNFLKILFLSIIFICLNQIEASQKLNNLKERRNNLIKFLLDLPEVKNYLSLKRDNQPKNYFDIQINVYRTWKGFTVPFWGKPQTVANIIEILESEHFSKGKNLFESIIEDQLPLGQLNFPCVAWEKIVEKFFSLTFNYDANKVAIKDLIKLIEYSIAQMAVQSGPKFEGSRGESGSAENIMVGSECEQNIGELIGKFSEDKEKMVIIVQGLLKGYIKQLRDQPPYFALLISPPKIEKISSQPPLKSENILKQKIAKNATLAPIEIEFFLAARILKNINEEAYEKIKSNLLQQLNYYLNPTKDINKTYSEEEIQELYMHIISKIEFCTPTSCPEIRYIPSTLPQKDSTSRSAVINLLKKYQEGHGNSLNITFEGQEIGTLFDIILQERWFEDSVLLPPINSPVRCNKLKGIIGTILAIDFEKLKDTDGAQDEVKSFKMPYMPSRKIKIKKSDNKGFKIRYVVEPKAIEEGIKHITVYDKCMDFFSYIIGMYAAKTSCTKNFDTIINLGSNDSEKMQLIINGILKAYVSQWKNQADFSVEVALSDTFCALAQIETDKNKLNQIYNDFKDDLRNDLEVAVPEETFVSASMYLLFPKEGSATEPRKMGPEQYKKLSQKAKDQRKGDIDKAYENIISKIDQCMKKNIMESSTEESSSESKSDESNIPLWKKYWKRITAAIISAGVGGYYWYKNRK